MDHKIDKRKAVIQLVKECKDEAMLEGIYTQLQNTGHGNSVSAQEAYRKRTLAGLESYARGEVVSLDEAMAFAMCDRPG